MHSRSGSQGQSPAAAGKGWEGRRKAEWAEQGRPKGEL